MTTVEKTKPNGTTPKGAATEKREIENAEYVAMLDRLSEGSIHRSFNPYTDIDWDAPEFQVVDDDPRWILPDIDPLGAHPWYQAQSVERQIAIGMYRQANVAKVGLLFEQVLIRGFMQYISMLPNRSAEFRYCTHEVIEECNHTLMFQELINRTGTDVPGFGPIMRRAAPFLGLAAWKFPSIFFMGVLGGEEPIDHIQKSYLRTEGNFHPVVKGVMRIHVAEEARHISFRARIPPPACATARTGIEIPAVADIPDHAPNPVRRHRGAAARLLAALRHSAIGEAGPVLAPPRSTEDAAQLLR